MKVEVHIEELVLHGVPPGQRYRVADALQAELGRLLARQLPQGLDAPRAADVVRPAPIPSSAAARPESLGAAVAAAVHGGLGR